MINPYKRYQTGLLMGHLFPVRDDQTCACGCGKELNGGRRKWFNDDCRRHALNQFHIIKGDTQVIRGNLYLRDQGFCRMCGVHSERWEADHIIPVSQGGGACSLDNLQTLCYDCHKEKTISLNAIPNSCYIHASSLNFIPSILDSLRAFHQRIGMNIEGKAVIMLD